MLTLTRKKYEFEEPIVIKDDSGNDLINYVMKITPEEKLEIRNLLFDEKDVENGRTLEKLERESRLEEYEQLEKKILENAKIRQERFEQIVFKEEREKIKSVAGESIYLDLVDMIFDFFVTAFVEKKAKQVNTMSTNLRKISGK